MTAEPLSIDARDLDDIRNLLLFRGLLAGLPVEIADRLSCAVPGWAMSHGLLDVRPGPLPPIALRMPHPRRASP
jgi:hypothetical protein